MPDCVILIVGFKEIPGGHDPGPPVFRDFLFLSLGPLHSVAVPESGRYKAVSATRRRSRWCPQQVSQSVSAGRRMAVLLLHALDTVWRWPRVAGIRLSQPHEGGREPVVKRSAGKRKDAGLTPRFGSPFSSKIVIYGHCLVTLPLHN